MITPTPQNERATVFSLASIFAIRMLGLFMILPVFSLYAKQLAGATPTLIGIALGIYGLSQALLQIPYGMLSDRFGRKPLITLGLLVFICGSIVAALSHHIVGVIIGRALQGAGAIGSTIMALVADLTREEKRTQAMATIGLTIGISFAVAMVLGPTLNHYIHVSGIFWFTAVLGGLAIVVLHTIVPNPTQFRRQRDTATIPSQMCKIASHPELLRLDFGIFCQHAILTATFVVMPVVLTEHAGLAPAIQWRFYLPILVLSFLTMVPFIILAEKKRLMKPVFISAIGIILLAQLMLAFVFQHFTLLLLASFLFFASFNLLEASLPSLVSKFAPVGSKGTALGIYSSSQFLGIFVGGSLAGWLYGQHSIQGVFLFCALLGLLWWFAALTMAKPPHLATFMLHTGPLDDAQAHALSEKLLAEPGVAAVFVGQEEGIAYLKIDNQRADKSKLMAFSREDA